MWHNASLRSIPLMLFDSVRDSWDRAKRYVILAGIFFVSLNSNDWLVYGVFALVIAVPVAFVTKYFQVYQFWVCSDWLRLKRGVFSKSEANLAISDIDKLTRSQNEIQKLLGLFTVRCYGNGDIEPALTIEHIDKKRVDLIEESAGASSEAMDQASDLFENECFWASLVLENTFRYLLPALAAFFTVVFFIQAESPSDMVPSFDLSTVEKSASAISSLSLLDVLSTTVSMTIQFYVIAWVGKAIMFTNKFGRFALAIDENRTISARHGVMRKYHWTLDAQNISRVDIKTNWFLERLGLYRLIFVTLDSEKTEHFVPCIRIGSLNELLRRIGYPGHTRDGFTRSSLRIALPNVISRSKSCLLLYGLLMYWADKEFVHSLTAHQHLVLITVIVSFLTVWIFIAIRNSGVAFRPDFVCVARMRVGRIYSIIEKSKIVDRTRVSRWVTAHRVKTYTVSIGRTDINVGSYTDPAITHQLGFV